VIRAVELSIFLTPVLVYFLWRRFAESGRLAPPRYALIALLAALVLAGAGLAWTGLKERHAEGSRYVPASMQDGRVVPGHGV
jgi:hypothetical protein